MVAPQPDSRRPQRRPWHRWIDTIFDHLTHLGAPTNDHAHICELARERDRWRALIKTPAPCDLCAAAAAAKEAAQEVIESILDSVVPTNRKRPGPPTSPPARDDSDDGSSATATWRGPTPTLPGTLRRPRVAGPLYGRSSRGRSLKRPVTFSGSGRQCPLRKQDWPLTLEPRAWSVPVKPGECGVCGQQPVKRRKTS